MIIHIPIYLHNDRTYVDISWQRDLILARDWLAPNFGQLTLLSPSLPIESMTDETMQLVSIGNDDGIRVIPSFDLRCRARSFWIKERMQWMSDVQKELLQAKVIHCSADDVYRPLWYLALMQGIKSGVTSVLVGPDMDPHLTHARGIKGRLECWAFDQLIRRASRYSDLVLLKEGAVLDRYGENPGNIKGFCHSMHREGDVVSMEKLEMRLQTLTENRPLRAVYAGRMIPRKGMVDSVEAIAAARNFGAEVEYHIYGSGPEEALMRKKGEELNVLDLLHFHGYVEYGANFIHKLADYDLLLFLPTEEDTPRMLYDSMAAGLPLVGTRIPFLEHRVKTEKIGILVDISQGKQAGEQLCVLNKNRNELAVFSRAAVNAGRLHAVEHWYARRAEWTQLAAQSRHRKSSRSIHQNRS